MIFINKFAIYSLFNLMQWKKYAFQNWQQSSFLIYNGYDEMESQIYG